MRVLAFIPLIIAYSTRERTWILLGLIVTGILIYSVMIFQNALSVVLSQALYQYIAHKKVIRNFDTQDLASAISQH